MIAAGRMRHRVTIQQPTQTVDSFGQKITTWTTVKSVWAEVGGNGGGTSAVANKGQITFGHTVTIRGSDDIAGLDETWRLLFKGRTLEISSITNTNELGALLVLTCTEEVQV